MGALRTLGTAALGLCIGALGVFYAIKRNDEKYVDGLWELLEHSTRSADVFTEDMVAHLPDPARRYFLHAIHPGTPLASRLHWKYTGSMKPRKDMPWMSLTAEQILAKNRGFVWKARARAGALVLTAADHYLDGDGRMRIALYSLIPVVNASGSDLAKSAMARLMIESVALPSSLLPGPNVRYEEIDQSRFTVTINLHGESTPITLTVDKEGRVKEVTLERWGNLTDDGSYQYIPYGATMDDEQAFDGYTIPTRLTVGWWYGTEQYLEVVRLKVDWARYA